MIEGTLEGYADEERRRYKVLQRIDSENSNLRHIVSYVYIFETYEEALSCKELYGDRASISIKAGDIVNLLDSMRNPVSGRDGRPYQYQVVSVYQETNKAGLVTYYGEYIGTYDIKDIIYVEAGPLFKREDYEEGTTVVWIDSEDVYEGIIETLHNSTATISQIKKLMPVDYKVRIPYWKIPEGRKSNEESTPQVLHTIIGDDLN